MLHIGEASAQADSHSEWKLVWADEFSGPKIDGGVWSPEVMPDPFNRELQYYTSRIDDETGSNAWIEDGKLVIEARAERFEHRRFTSARLITRGKREFLYGRFEARMRLPAETGMWPAFWLLGSNIGEVGWPRCGEIDVMEGKGRLRNWVSGALHRGPAPEANQIIDKAYRLPSGDFHTQWHTFAVEWEPEEIRWYVNDVEFQTVKRPPAATPEYWPFDEGHPFYLILNLAVGGWFDEPHLPPDDMSAQRLYVDYVRVYEITEGKSR